MQPRFVRPLFYSDAHAVAQFKHLKTEDGARVSNVYENWSGDQYFGGARGSRHNADLACGVYRRGSRALYRVVVRLK